MPHLNANIPYQLGWVRDCYLYDDPNQKGLTECFIFGVKAVINQPLRFHCQLENGAVFWSLPLSAYVWKKDFEMLGSSEEEILPKLQWWDCQSSDISVTVFSYLQGYKVDFRSRDKNWYSGKYLFTIDDYYADLNSLPVGYADDPDSKCFHFIQLDNGRYCVSPNNFLRWHNLNFCEPYDIKNPPRYRAFGLELKAEREV